MKICKYMINCLSSIQQPWNKWSLSDLMLFSKIFINSLAEFLNSHFLLSGAFTHNKLKITTKAKGLTLRMDTDVSLSQFISSMTLLYDHRSIGVPRGATFEP